MRASVRYTLLSFGSALLVTASVTAPASAAPSYQPGDYTLTVDHAYLVDIQGTVEHGKCAEVYGFVHVDKGSASKITDHRVYFNAPKASPVDVCEPNRPLSDGKQTGPLPKNGNWQPWTLHFNGNSADQGWRFSSHLYDYDHISADDLICNQQSGWLFPSTNTTPKRGVVSCKGEGEFNIEYTIRRQGT